MVYLDPGAIVRRVHCSGCDEAGWKSSIAGRRRFRMTEGNCVVLTVRDRFYADDEYRLTKKRFRDRPSELLGASREKSVAELM